MRDMSSMSSKSRRNYAVVNASLYPWPGTVARCLEEPSKCQADELASRQADELASRQADTSVRAKKNRVDNKKKKAEAIMTVAFGHEIG